MFAFSKLVHNAREVREFLLQELVNMNYKEMQAQQSVNRYPLSTLASYLLGTLHRWDARAGVVHTFKVFLRSPKQRSTIADVALFAGESW